MKNFHEVYGVRDGCRDNPITARGMARKEEKRWVCYEGNSAGKIPFLLHKLIKFRKTILNT